MIFLFDKNLSPRLAKGLKAFGENVEHLDDHLPADTPDVNILEYLYDHDMVLITRDKNIRRNDAEKGAIYKYKAGVFFLGGANLDAWQIIEQVIRNWRRIKELSLNTSRPFAFSIRSKGKEITRII